MTVAFEEAPPVPEWMAEDYAFTRRVAVVDGRRMHFVDEGDGPTVLMVHGNPTWSFLWRKVIARLLPKGYRCVAPDLIGLGLSDKPRAVGAHTLEMHVEALRKLVEALDIRDATIAGQDWGGPIVTGVAAREPGRVRGVVYANTQVLAPRKRIKATAFHRFSHMPIVSTIAFRGLNFPVPMMHRVQGNPASIGRRERRAYAWPLRRWRNRAAPLAMARMVPNRPDHPSVPILHECGEFVQQFEGPAALVWGAKDPILGRSLKRLREALPRASVTETQAGHFLQEEVPDELAVAIAQVAEQAATP